MTQHDPSIIEQLAMLKDAVANFDFTRSHEYNAENGWRIDVYQIELPKEPVGSPMKGQSFELATQILINYEFPDPRIIEGFFQQEEDLLNRVMLLKAKFLWFRFYFGVRISQVIDHIVTQDNQSFQEWGYSYYTLDGHWEMGEITFKVRKNLDTGSVFFHINAYSRTGKIDNIFYRFGFKLFGRTVQVAFAERALQRMSNLVEQRLPK